MVTGKRMFVHYKPREKVALHNDDCGTGDNFFNKKKNLNHISQEFSVDKSYVFSIFFSIHRWASKSEILQKIVLHGLVGFFLISLLFS